MIVLSVFAVTGKGLVMIPMPKNLVSQMNASDSKSVFLLGMFSGAATSCCAPVLAGAVTLAVISGAFWKALIVTFAYVFGMTFPLFIAAYLYDRFKIENSRFIQGKLLEIKFPAFALLRASAGRGTKTFFIHSTNMLAGAVFFIMGAILLVLAFSDNAFWSPSFQVGIGKTFNAWSQNILDILSNAPEFIWGIIIIGIFFFFLHRAKKGPSE